jgi:hypothetical protein
MQNSGENRELVERARKRVEEIKGFYIHLGVYLIVNAVLFTIDMIASPGTLWFFWPLLGWGAGVAVHGFAVLTESRLLGPEWEERKMHEILQREAARASHDA